ncbi:MAG: transporter substrate-binding domain-containing protein [Bdellovibrionales bacterium]|jgi:ABC-type amino acid transport substrate-binding protein
MKISHVLLVVGLSAAVAFGTVRYVASTAPSSGAAAKESTFERVTRTGTIRCGYSVWNPLFYIDPQTNEKRGIFHDMMEEVGTRLGLKIVWQEEIGWGMVTESVRNGRVDMACAGYWLNPARIKLVATSAPQLYSPLYVWGRQDDPRHFNNPEELNSDKVTVVQTEGSAEIQSVAKRFPKAKVLSLPELDTISDEIETLLTKKADFLVADASSVSTYTARNPGKIKNLFPSQAMNVYPTVMLLPPDDLRFKEVIDDTLRNVEYDGTLDDILKKYGKEHSYLRNPLPVNRAP